MKDAGLPPDIPAADRTPEPGAGVIVYLVRSGALVAVDRSLPTVSLAAVLDTLVKGPTAGEVEQGLRSAIPNDVEVMHAASEGSVARIDLAPDFFAIPRDEQLLAVAQFVLTVTAMPTVNGVVFTLNDTEVEVPHADGTVSGGALVREDFTALIA